MERVRCFLSLAPWLCLLLVSELSELLAPEADFCRGDGELSDENSAKGLVLRFFLLRWAMSLSDTTCTSSSQESVCLARRLHVLTTADASSSLKSSSCTSALVIRKQAQGVRDKK